MHKPTSVERSRLRLATARGVPVPRELVEYWDRRLLERRERDWT